MLSLHLLQVSLVYVNTLATATTPLRGSAEPGLGATLAIGLFQG